MFKACRFILKVNLSITITDRCLKFYSISKVFWRCIALNNPHNSTRSTVLMKICKWGEVTEACPFNPKKENRLDKESREYTPTVCLSQWQIIYLLRANSSEKIKVSVTSELFRCANNYAWSWNLPRTIFSSQALARVKISRVYYKQTNKHTQQQYWYSNTLFIVIRFFLLHNKDPIMINPSLHSSLATYSSRMKLKISCLCHALQSSSTPKYLSHWYALVWYHPYVPISLVRFTVWFHP